MNGPTAEGLPPLPAYDDRRTGEAGPVLGDVTRPAWLIDGVDGDEGTWLLTGDGDYWRSRWESGLPPEVLPSAQAVRETYGVRQEGPHVAALLAAARCPSCRPVGGGYCQTCGKPL